MRLTKGIKFEIIEADLENKDKLIYGVFKSEVKGRTIYYARLKILEYGQGIVPKSKNGVPKSKYLWNLSIFFEKPEEYKWFEKGDIIQLQGSSLKRVEYTGGNGKVKDIMIVAQNKDVDLIESPKMKTVGK